VTLNPLKVGAVCVALGALLWMAPSSWFEKAPRPEPKAPTPTHLACPQEVSGCAQCG
jgi:hypothetical protein